MYNWDEFFGIEKILESMIIESFTLTDDLLNILEKIHYSKRSSKIALIFIKLSEISGAQSAVILDISSSNKHILFLDNKSKRETEIRIGKLVKWIVDLYNSKFGTNFNFTPVEIEQFVNLYKSNYDYEFNRESNFKIVSGSEINFWYDENNYADNNGPLGNSCMKYSHINHFMDVYADCKNVKMLILLNPEGLLTGRALLWSAKCISPMHGDIHFMDRIYTSSDSDVFLFLKWAEDNNYAYKHRQSSMPEDILEICIPGSNWKPVTVELECQWHKIPFEDREEEFYPYMDTLKYFYWKEGVLRNFIKKGSYYVILGETNGWCSWCKFCNTGGQYGDGDGREDCSACMGTGRMDRDALQGRADEPRIALDAWCIDCRGEGSLPCSVCGGFSY